jgi:3-dehydroquinate dehydratase
MYEVIARDDWFCCGSSIAIIDALKACGGIAVEVHISNVRARDELHGIRKCRRRRPP